MSISRNDTCWCGSGKKWKKCHYPQNAPQSAAALRERYRKQYQILLKDDKQIEGIRRACQLTAQILEATCAKAQKGVTTAELNRFAHQLCIDAGARPATLGYGSPPYPASICTSLNEVICHGIPNNVPLVEGDILNIDFSCVLDGFYGDCSRMVTIGKISAEKQLVVDVAYECLMKAIAILRPGVAVKQIGAAIEDHAEERGCSVVYQFVAHGVGVAFHEAPQIPHYRNKLDIPLAPGMTFTIEPMINAGTAEAVIDAQDQWTATTADGRPSAQFEHTLLITETGYEILTPWKR